MIKMDINEFIIRKIESLDLAVMALMALLFITILIVYVNPPRFIVTVLCVIFFIAYSLLLVVRNFVMWRLEKEVIKNKS